MNHDVAAVGEVTAGLVMDALFVDKRVFGPYHRAELMAFVIDGEVEVGIGIFLAQYFFYFRQGEVSGILIDIDFLEANDIRILRHEELQHVVFLRFLKAPHACGIPCEDGKSLCCRSIKGSEQEHQDKPYVTEVVHLFGVKVTSGTIISSREMPPCWKVLR